MKKSLKNRKAFCKNQKAIVTHLSITTLKDPLILITLSEDDSEDEVVGEKHVSGEDVGDADEEDDEEADGDEDDKEDEDEEEDGEDEEFDG